MSLMKRLFLTVIALVVAAAAAAQSDYVQLVPINHGLAAPQSEADLPHSKAAVVWPERVPHRSVKGQLEWIPGTRASRIVDGWEMISARDLTALGENILSPDCNTSSFYNATVPGTVLTTLVDQGVYPDPYYGLNNLAIPDDLCRQDWWYRVKFAVKDPLRFPRKELLFNGINYEADVWFNGVFLGRISGAFIRGRFDVTGLVKEEDNVLAVHILPPHNPGIPHEQNSREHGDNGGALCADGPTFICTEGWDWIPGIRDRNIGIWQDMELIEGGLVSLGDTRVITDLPLPDTSYADITVRTVLRNHSSDDVTVWLKTSLNAEFSESVKVTVPASGEIPVELCDPLAWRIYHPALWWPNGYGAPNLYNLQLFVETLDGSVSDSQSIRFGIREMSYELTVDTSSRQGVRIDYEPTGLGAEGDIFNHRRLREVGEGVCVPSLRSDSAPVCEIEDDGTGPFLVVKVNGVRIFCRGGNWGIEDAMKRIDRERLEPYFKLHKEAGLNMIRNWTGESTDEIFYTLADEYGLLVWNDFWLSTEGFNLDVNDEDLFMSNATDVVRRFRNHPCIAVWCPRNEGYATPGLEPRLAAMIAAEDGTRRYHPNSRYCNLKPSGPWTFFDDVADYFRREARGFNTEIGTPCVPTAAALRKFIPEEDLWPVSDVWNYHDHHNGLWQPNVAAMEQRFGVQDNVDDFCNRMQLMNYDTHRAIYEAWNSRMWGDATGVMLWMTHPAWPSLTWQIYTWDYETAGAYFGVKKACEPIHIQRNADSGRVVVINATNSAIRGAKATVCAYDLYGKRLSRATYKLPEIAADALTQVCDSSPSDVYLLRLELRDSRGRLLSRNDYVERCPQNSFEGVRVKVRERTATTALIEYSNLNKTVAVGIPARLFDLEDNQVLPAYYSENYFNLLPGEKQFVEVQY